jgi:hypothetical protein
MKTNFNKSKLIANASNFNEIKKITFLFPHSFHLLIHIPSNLLHIIGMMGGAIRCFRKRKKKFSEYSLEMKGKLKRHKILQQQFNKLMT